MILSKEDKKNIKLFENDITELVIKRRKENDYIDRIREDDAFIIKGLRIVNRYLDTIENKIEWKKIAYNWIYKLEKDPGAVEPYMLHGLTVIVGAIGHYISTGEKVEL